LRLESMQKFKSENRYQAFLLPPSVEEFVSEDHLARVINEVVDSLDTSVVEQKYSYLGQKSYHPKTLLKILFYGYAIGVRSGRKISAHCESDVAFMYLACMYKPDFRTINDFRKNNADTVASLFVQVVRLCAALKMVQLGTLVIDSTKIRANASGRRTRTKEQYEQWLSSVEKQIEGIMQQADDTDRQEDELYGSKRGDELPADINTKEKLRNKLQEAIKSLNEGEKQNLTDKDAKIIKGSGRLQTNYNCQASCTLDGIIVSAFATNNASDREQLAEVVSQAESNTEQVSKTILADGGYASYNNYEHLASKDKVILIPDQEKSTEHLKATTDPYHRNHFIYDEDNDVFICPEGKPLPYHSNYEHQKNKQKGRYYQGTECKVCSKRSLCAKGSVRQIHVEQRMPLRQKIRELLDSVHGKALYKLRQQTIEPIFGHLKYNLKYTIFHLRTLEKVNAEWQLICLAQNIRKIWQMKLQVAA
jgi:transposase